MTFFNIWTSSNAKNSQFLTLLTSKCALRHNGVHFFDIWTSKSGQKVVQTRQPFTLLTSTCALRHNGVHVFDISTSKSGPNPSVFYTFDFWLGNVLRATTAYTFSTSQLPRVVRDPQFFTFLPWKMCFAPQQRALFFDVATSKNGPRIVCFVHFDL